jgi:tetratricopeptide (TPR) repeat protein
MPAPLSRDEAEAPADFDLAVLGRGLPPEAERLIAAAGLVRSDQAQAEPLLLQARALAPTHPATLIALYRFHFYGHRLREAREIAKQSLDIGRAALCPDYSDELRITDEQARFDATARFYLFVLKGYAYLSLRLGDIEAGRQALNELRELDPQDRVGGGLLAHVLKRAESGDDADETRIQPIAHRGWSQP